MVKKVKPAATVRPARKPAFTIEDSPWFAPVMFVVLLAGLLVLFGEFIFSDKMLHSSDTIQAGMFFRSYLVDYFHEHGRMPMWNPYIFGGMPFVDAFHGDIFYPLAFIKYFMSTHRFLGMVLVLHIFLAGIFMYLCARQFKLSKIPSLFAATAYMFSPYLVSLVSPGHDGKMYVTALFPLAMLFLDRAFERRPFLNTTLLGLVIGFIIISPHVQMAYFSLWAMALYTVFRLIFLWREKRQFAPIITTGSMVLYSVVLGLLISAIQFWPGYKYTTEYSPRAESKRGWEWAISWSMHEEEAFSLLIPEFSGVAAKESGTYYWGKNYFKDNSESTGATLFFVGLLGAFFARRREAYFFAGLSIFALIYALGATTPVFRLFFTIMPLVKSLRAPSMIMFLFSFSFAIMAAMVIQRWRDIRREEPAREKKFNYLLWGFPACMLVLALLFTVNGRGMISMWTSLFFSGAAEFLVQQGVSKLDVAYLNLPAIQSGAWFAFFFSAIAAGLIWLYRSGKVGAGMLAVLLFVPMVEDMRFNSRFIDTFDPDQMWSVTPEVNFFKQTPGNYRVMSLSHYQSDVLPYFGIEVVVGYHGNQLRWYDDLLGGPQITNMTNPRFLNLVGAEYITDNDNRQIPPNYFGPEPVEQVAAYGANRIIRNPNAFPRAFLVGQYRILPDWKDITPLVLRGTEDLRQVAFLEQEPGLAISPDFAPGDSAWVVEHAIDTVTLGVRTSTNKILVLTDVYYNAWQVTVDGRPAELLRSYGAFRAVAVPAGSSTVTFTYHSDRYETGRLITWLTSLFIVAIIAVHEVRRRRVTRT